MGMHFHRSQRPFAAVLAIVGLVLVGLISCSAEGDDPEERVCDGSTGPCSCQALADGWCIGYHSDSGSLPDGECLALGGQEIEEACPQTGEAARCREVDDCHSPAYIFYDNYEGGFEDYDSLADLENACNAGELVGSTCADWVE